MISPVRKNILTFLICFLSFLLGVVTMALLPVMPFEKGLQQLFVQVFPKQTPPSNTPLGEQNFLDKSLDFRLFSEVYEKVAGNYYGFDSISKKDLISGMIKGFIEALGDKHSEYFNTEETKKFNEVLSGDFEGIGAVIEKNDFGVVVERIIAGSPAKESGILSGDIIIKANGEELKDITLTDAVAKIRGPAETVVELEIVRPGQKELLTKKVTRKKITIPSVDGKIIPETEMGYITLSIFGEKTADDFKKILDELLTKNPKGLIIDLRDNGGGYLETAVTILSNFVEKDKTLVVTKEKNPLLNRSYFSYGNTYKPLPIVVLINENSASASEITAGALSDYSLAILVGQKSYGKGSVQQPFTLSDGSEMKITVAKWYTPKDHGIDKVGIKPDIEVGFEKEDYEKNYDRQLEEAKKILSSFIQTGDKNKVVEEYLKNAETLKKQTLENITASGGGKK